MVFGVRLHGASEAVASVLRAGDVLDRALTCDAELEISEISTSASVLGAFQRGFGAPSGELVRRATGGSRIHVGPGTLHVVLALRTPSALASCDGPKLVNRYVRPLLRALTKGGALAHYFGRDWISVHHRPAGAVGFAHDGTSGRAAFEAFVAVQTPFAEAGGPYPSFLGKEPGTLEAIVGRPLDMKVLAELVRDAYGALAGGNLCELPHKQRALPTTVGEALRSEPDWEATVQEAIGPVCAGRDALGVLRLGGDFMASRDAVTRIETQVAALREEALTARDVGEIVNEALAPPAAILGVKDLGSVASVLLAARAQNRA